MLNKTEDHIKFPHSNQTYEDVTNHPLFPIFVEAIRQVMYGKGRRHGGLDTPFMEQPWSHYVKLHGRGFLTGQSTKKLEEAANCRFGEAFVNEVLGAIVYAGMSIIAEREFLEVNTPTPVKLGT